MKPRIVLAEQSATVRRMVEIALHGLGYDIETRQHADVVGDTVRAEPTALLIIRSDLSGADAVSIARRLAEDPSTSHIPRLLLMSRSEPKLDGEEQALFAGSQRKPFLSQDLVETVCRILDIEVPNVDLYQPYGEAIPLARPGSTPTQSAETDVEMAEVPVVVSTDVEIVPQEGDSEASLDSEVTAALDSGVSGSGGTELEAETNNEMPAVAHFTDSSVTAIDVGVGVADRTLDEVHTHRPNADGETVRDLKLGAIDSGSDGGSDLAEPIESSSLKPVEVTDDGPVESVEIATDNDIEIVEIAASELSIIDGPPSGPVDSQHQGPRTPNETSPPTVEDLPAAVESTEPNIVARALNDVTDEEALKALGASREVVERVAWAVVPALAEAILREEIARAIRDQGVKPDQANS